MLIFDGTTRNKSKILSRTDEMLSNNDVANIQHEKAKVKYFNNYF